MLKTIFAVGAAAMCLSTSAQAATIMVTFAGKIEWGVDGGGLFGAAGADLAGLAYTTKYLVDDTLLRIEPNGYEFIEGGTQYGTVSPILQADLTINGITQAVANPVYGGYIAQDAQGFYNGLYYWQLYASVTAPSGGDTLNSGCRISGAQTHTTGVCTSVGQGFFSIGGLTRGGLLADVASTDSPLPTGTSYVPEPATWAMMIAGFGMAGASLRRRRAALAAA